MPPHAPRPTPHAPRPAEALAAERAQSRPCSPVGPCPPHDRGNDESQGIFKGSYFGPYKDGLWPYQYGKMRERAPAVANLGPLKNSMLGSKPSGGGCSQLNALFYALYVMTLVQVLLPPPPYPHPFFADTCLCPCPPASAT